MVRRALIFTSLLLALVAAVATALGGRPGDAVAAAGIAESPLIGVLDEPLSAGAGTTDEPCHASWRPGAPGVATRVVPVAAGLGHLRVALGGAAGDWDVAVFDAGEKAVVASAEPDAEESATGWTAAGGTLRVQACRVSGDAASVPVTLEHATVTGDAEAIRADPPRLARVYVPTPASRDLLLSLGLDMTEHGGVNTLGVVLHGDADEATLRHARLRYDILVKDLIAQGARQRQADLARASRATALPSGRTGTYRMLADYNDEMKKLAEENPDLVKLFVMPNKTLLGKDVMGVEIAKNVNRQDGRPAFFNMGVHHAREWPAGEMPMEWAHELVNGFKSGDARATEVVTKSRNIIVPIVNPDGFEASRSAGELGGAGGGRDESIPDTAYIVGGAAFGGEYRRKNCRLPDDSDAANCSTSPGAFVENGVDPNRNYGQFWGGPGAESTPEGLTYRGAGPFSEPETRNIQSVVSRHQVLSLITNHTTAGLILRAPGVAALGDPVDEHRGYKALGDAMAKENGYFSQKGFELYDTTGTTEDWSYNATGGFGFTFEIYCGAANYETGNCDDPAFHPTFAVGVEKEWNGDNPVADHTDDPSGAYDGKGNREAYYIAAESTLNVKRHSIIEGTAPAGATLRLTKSFKTHAFDDPDSEEEPATTEDHLETVYEVGANGRYEWHVNPSTRPLVAKDRGKTNPGAPAPEETTTGGLAGSSETEDDPDDGAALADATNMADPPSLNYNDHPFTVPAAGDNGSVSVRVEWPSPVSDWDVDLYEDANGDGKSQVGERVVGSSKQGTTNFEEVSVGDGTQLEPGKKYVLRVINFAATEPYTVTKTYHSPVPFQAAAKERWTLTCEVGGQVRQTERVYIDRGERKTLNLTACAGGDKPEPPAKCKASNGFRSVAVKPAGRGARIGFKRAKGARGRVDVKVFQQARGRKLTPNTLVARFPRQKRSVRWNGRANVAGTKVTDGVYYVRLAVKARRGNDVRRVVLRRSGGRFTVVRNFHRRASCGLLRQFKLSRPAFGGRGGKTPLRIRFKLGAKADVAITVSREGGDVVKRYAFAGAPAGRNRKVTLPAKSLKRGLYLVRLAARGESRRVTATLAARRL